MRHPHRNSYYVCPGKHRSGFFFILLLVFLSEVQGQLNERLKVALEKYLSARPDFLEADRKLVKKLIITHLGGGNLQELPGLASRLHGTAAYRQVLSKLQDLRAEAEDSSSSTSSDEAPWRRQRKGPKVQRSRSPAPGSKGPEPAPPAPPAKAAPKPLQAKSKVQLFPRPKPKAKAKAAPKTLKAKSKVRLVPRAKVVAKAARRTLMPRGSIAQEQLEVQQSEVQQSEVQQSRVQRSEVPGSSSSSSTSHQSDEGAWQTDTNDWVERDCWVCHACNSMNLRFTQWCVCGEQREIDENWAWKPSEDDWICYACGNRNFKWREWCFWSACPTKDWTCVCGNFNFARRLFCNYRKCQKPRPW